MAPTVITGLAANGIPNVALNAYRVAATRMANNDPSCGIDWSLLAGIGRVESDHGRFGGAVLNPDGTSTPRIIGPSLDGVQFAFIRDTDRGLWDGDPVQDRAVGPMQFIPATWRSYGVSASGRGRPDPFNINDAALGAAHYLCVAGGDLRTASGQRNAVLAYNHSDSYVNEVLGLAHAYATGIPVADLPLVGNTTGAIPPPSGYYGGPASPGPAIGASDMTPPSGNTTGATARPAGSSGGGDHRPAGVVRRSVRVGRRDGHVGLRHGFRLRLGRWHRHGWGHTGPGGVSRLRWRHDVRRRSRTCPHLHRPAPIPVPVPKPIPAPVPIPTLPAPLPPPPTLPPAPVPALPTCGGPLQPHC